MNGSMFQGPGSGFVFWFSFRFRFLVQRSTFGPLRLGDLGRWPSSEHRTPEHRTFNLEPEH
jgi:hypothetical protein